MRYLIISIAAFLTACQSGPDQPEGINGQLENGAGKNISLNHIDNNNNVTLEQTVIDENGNFAFGVRPGPQDFYTLVIDDQQIVLFTDSTENIQITGDAENLLSSYDISGSTHSKVLRDYYAGSRPFRDQLESIQQEFQAVSQTGDAVKQQELINSFEVARSEYQEYQIDFLNNNSHSPVGVSILGELDPEENLEIFKKIHQNLSGTFSHHVYYSMLGSQIAQAEQKIAATVNLQPGKIAPEIELTNPQGKVIPLSSLRGKVVLIDFWASWCMPCRRENPNVVRMYNQYAGKGFEIYGVSLDRDKDKWVQAIKDDGLTWPQVSDLKFWNSAAAQIYSVTSIPHTVLIDREGKIIVSGLRGKALEDKIAEVLNT